MIIAVGVTLILALILVIRSRRNKHTVKQLDKIIRPYKLEEITSIIIPDGIGGLIEIDRLVLTERGILLIGTYQITGHLFGAQQIDQWTQIVEGRSYKFANPMHHIENAKYALQQLAPKVPIFCRVVFTGESDFPKGRPDNVSTLQTLEQDLKTILDAPKLSAMSDHAWQRILRIARKNGQAASMDGGS